MDIIYIILPDHSFTDILVEKWKLLLISEERQLPCKQMDCALKRELQKSHFSDCYFSNEALTSLFSKFLDTAVSVIKSVTHHYFHI